MDEPKVAIKIELNGKVRRRPDSGVGAGSG